MESMKSNLKFAVFGIALLSLLAGAMLAANSTASAATQSGNQTMMSKNMTGSAGSSNMTSGNMTGSAGGTMAKNATK